MFARVYASQTPSASSPNSFTARFFRFVRCRYYANGVPWLPMRFVETPMFTATIRRHLDDAYTKSEQGDLTAGQARQLSRVVREEFK